MRQLKGVGAFAAVGGLVAALAVAAPASAAPARVKPAVSIGDGTVLLILKGRPRPTKADAARAHPCLAYTYADDRVQVCVHDGDWAKVRHTGATQRTPYLIPYRVQRWSQRRLAIVMRQADVVLPAGRAKATAWCTDDCGRSNRPVRVFPLRVRSCTAASPWLVHSAQRPMGKVVAITFDDGPDAMTPAVLRILEDRQVAATFFTVGRMAVQRPQLLPRMIADGHVIGNHTWNHPVMNGGAAEQITDVQHMVKKLTGFRPCLFRAPYGENPPDVVALAQSLGLTTVNWNVDPGDWRGSPADTIVATALSETRPGSIAVFHDGGTHLPMLAALPRYIDELQRRHYRFVTVPELLGLPVSYTR